MLYRGHIAHIVHIARNPGRVDVQRVGGHIAHIVHIAWSWGRVDVQRVGGHIAHIVHIAWSWGRVDVQRVGGHIAHIVHIAWTRGGVEVQRAQLCVFGQDGLTSPARVCARAGVSAPNCASLGKADLCAFARASAWSVAVSRITGRCTRPSNSPPWRPPCRARTFASRAQSP